MYIDSSEPTSHNDEDNNANNNDEEEPIEIGFEEISILLEHINQKLKNIQENNFSRYHFLKLYILQEY